MTLKEFANTFDMSVNELCELTGYSRMGLNEIVTGRSTKQSAKRDDARVKLIKYTMDLYESELNKAIEERDERYKLIGKKI